MSACHSDANTFYFDVILKNDGLNTMELSSFGIAIDLNYSAIGGGNIEIQYVDNSSDIAASIGMFSFTNKTSNTYSSAGNPRFVANAGLGFYQLQLLSHSITCPNGLLMQANTNYRIGTFKVTNKSSDWSFNSAPSLTFNNQVPLGGRKQTTIFEYFNGNCTTGGVTTWATNCVVPTVCNPIPEFYDIPCSGTGLI